jgi:hypothetical protein
MSTHASPARNRLSISSGRCRMGQNRNVRNADRRRRIACRVCLRCPARAQRASQQICPPAVDAAGHRGLAEVEPRSPFDPGLGRTSNTGLVCDIEQAGDIKIKRGSRFYQSTPTLCFKNSDFFYACTQDITEPASNSIAGTVSVPARAESGSWASPGSTESVRPAKLRGW